MELIVKLEPNVAAAVRGERPATPQSEELVRRTEELGLSLRPADPGVGSPELRSSYFFGFEAPDLDTAEHLARELLRMDGVEAAYPKPAAEPP